MSKSLRQKFGVSEKAIPATRVLVKGLDSSKFNGQESQAILAINDQTGTFTAANVYGGNLGKSFNAAHYTHDLPVAGSAKWKEWAKRGYVEGNLADFDVLEWPPSPPRPRLTPTPNFRFGTAHRGSDSLPSPVGRFEQTVTSVNPGINTLQTDPEVVNPEVEKPFRVLFYLDMGIY